MILLVVCFLTGGASIAHSAELPDSTDYINAIKRDTTYLYAESTMRDRVEALSGACAVLELKVAEWVRRQYPERAS